MRDSFSSVTPCSRYWPPVMMQVPSRTEKRNGTMKSITSRRSSLNSKCPSPASA